MPFSNRPTASRCVTFARSAPSACSIGIISRNRPSARLIRTGDAMRSSSWIQDVRSGRPSSRTAAAAVRGRTRAGMAPAASRKTRRFIAESIRSANGSLSDGRLAHRARPPLPAGFVERDRCLLCPELGAGRRVVLVVTRLCVDLRRVRIGGCAGALGGAASSVRCQLAAYRPRIVSSPARPIRLLRPAGSPADEILCRLGL